MNAFLTVVFGAILGSILVVAIALPFVFFWGWLVMLVWGSCAHAVFGQPTLDYWDSVQVALFLTVFGSFFKSTVSSNK